MRPYGRNIFYFARPPSFLDKAASRKDIQCFLPPGRIAFRLVRRAHLRPLSLVRLMLNPSWLFAYPGVAPTSLGPPKPYGGCTPAPIGARLAEASVVLFPEMEAGNSLHVHCCTSRCTMP